MKRCLLLDLGTVTVTGWYIGTGRSLPTNLPKVLFQVEKCQKKYVNANLTIKLIVSKTEHSVLVTGNGYIGIQLAFKPYIPRYILAL